MFLINFTLILRSEICDLKSLGLLSWLSVIYLLIWKSTWTLSSKVPSRRFFTRMANRTILSGSIYLSILRFIILITKTTILNTIKDLTWKSVLRKWLLTVRLLRVLSHWLTEAQRNYIYLPIVIYYDMLFKYGSINIGIEAQRCDEQRLNISTSAVRSWDQGRSWVV